MSRSRANLLLLITAFIWGTAFVAQQSSLEDLGPFYFTAIRFVIGGLLVLPFGLRELRRLRENGHDLERKHWLGMGLVGAFLFLGSISQQIGLKYTSVTNAGFFTGIYVPLVPILMLVSGVNCRTGPFGRRPWAVWLGHIICPEAISKSSILVICGSGRCDLLGVASDFSGFSSEICSNPCVGGFCAVYLLWSYCGCGRVFP